MRLNVWINEKTGRLHITPMTQWMLALLWPVIEAAEEACEYHRCDDVNGEAGGLMHKALVELEQKLKEKT